MVVNEKTCIAACERHKNKGNLIYTFLGTEKTNISI